MDMHELYAEAERNARAMAGDALDGVDSVITLQDLIAVLVEAYVAGATR